MSATQHMPFEVIGDMYECLKDAAFAYQQPEYRLQKEKSPSNLFSERDLTRWDKQRSDVKRLTQEHTELMVDLMDCQEQCWKTRDKMKQYVSMLECAKMSLPHHVDDERNYNARKYAIKELKKDVIHRQKAHSKNVGKYHTILTAEQSTRQEMIEISKELESAMTSRLRQGISQAWTSLCIASDPTKFSHVLDPDHISQSIYDITCKRYTFIKPSNDISSFDFNMKIQRPRIQVSVYSYTDTSYPTYGDSCNQRTTLSEDTGQIPDYFLKLKKGDKLRLKLISSDGAIGFGYNKQYKISAKKWGFVYLSSLLIDDTDLE
ncbi:uncharacterized protein LOC123527716 isoform X2 [Mercenaria mercenaria]|uniref:uncharacterized protein LOC123527716 isoform X1 n=1 Tax=Mercenaria mercenaria TaxID=6596 RepID=UPI00234F9D7D|nr:uncharacterized protein LOC123527716 isoform X1 [Mercenaria mercenaria]XP_053379894.1 uncharacterized protein LOC123527716 isoform X2 [Mercenaria mercenaria]